MIRTGLGWATADEKMKIVHELRWVHGELGLTGRGKHVGRFSYYHRMLAEERDGVLACLEETRRQLHDEPFEFNVIKLDARSCVSFLRYEEFATAPFPALLAALSCDISRGTARNTLFFGRRNPPILHRKELLLPADSPLVPEAARLTKELELLGAFDDPHRIGTRDGWNTRLASLGASLDGGIPIGYG